MTDDVVIENYVIPSVYRIDAPDVYLKDTGTAKGRGVFANRDFEKGEVVERCPVLLMPIPLQQLPEEVKSLLFSWRRLAGTPQIRHALALGFGSMYNHDNPANMRYEAERYNQVLTFITVRRVAKDEELTINYNAGGGGPASTNDNWFRRRNIKPLTTQRGNRNRN